MDSANANADLERVRRACGVLLRIPGVISVGLGHKLKSRQDTGELAFSVMVLEKKPLSALAPHEVVPAEIDGLLTDIVEGLPPRLIADLIEEEEQEDFDSGVPRDRAEYRPIVGGIQIRGERSKLPNGAHTFGTLGGFATTTGKDPGKHVLLTNHHVVDDAFGSLHEPSCTGCSKDLVGNPNVGSRIGFVLRGRNDRQLDAAIAVLDKGMQFDRDIIKDDEPSQREAIGPSRPLDTSDIGIRVHKRGHRSRITYGIVGAVAVTTPEIQASPRPEIKENQIRIDLVLKVSGASFINFEANNRLVVPSVDFAARGVEALDVAFIQGDPNAGRYRITEVVGPHTIAVASATPLKTGEGTHGFIVTPRLFGLKGDSGSLVLDDNRRVVGLLWAADTTNFVGNAWANPIDVVERDLQIVIDSASTIGQTQTASGDSLEPRIVVPADDERSRAAAAGAAGEPVITLRERVEGDLLPSSRGRQIYDLYFRHHMEVRALLATNRRVAVVWHRQGGPGIVQGVLDAVRSRETPVPATIRGRSWSERIGAILSVFAEHGSQRLRGDIERFGHEVEALGGMTYTRFLASLGA